MTPAPAFLVIQTAFIGDVVLATALVEKLHYQFPNSDIDFLLRKGNEDLLKCHPFLRHVLVWEKKQNKIKSLLGVIKQVRANHYDYVINVHRFTSSGLITLFSGARVTIGFDKNPLSFFFSRKAKHAIAPGTHEVSRNQELISGLTDYQPARPRLYPSQSDYNRIMPYQQPQTNDQGVGYICIAPTSVWFTKQYPKEKWIEFIDTLQSGLRVYLLGGHGDWLVCENIRSVSKHSAVVNLAGELSFLESAALMQFATMNYVNDSAPMHFASAVNGQVTAVFCSTIPEFGFGPLSDRSFVVQTTEKLSCRPCGLHGFNSCPEGHFRCALSITKEQLTADPSD